MASSATSRNLLTLLMVRRHETVPEQSLEIGATQCAMRHAVAVKWLMPAEQVMTAVSGISYTKSFLVSFVVSFSFVFVSFFSAPCRF